jgi:FtsP/CotA-like multicopper oxidase with cupredoxin domain
LLRAGVGALAAAGANKINAESVDFDLIAARTWVTIGGRSVELISYNGQVPGPTIDLHPGQEVTIRLRNQLTEPTNLHFHGLHVPPNPGVDDSFLQIPPGAQHEYRFTLPANHTAGTFWYHPHVHGRAADQVGGGLAGALIVRSQLEDALGLSGIPEHLIVLQDFDITSNGTLARPSEMDLMSGREGPLVTASGQVRPSFPLRTGGFLRLRAINASSSRFYYLRLEDHALVTIGLDGGLLPSPQEADAVLLTPGERVDLVIRGDREPGIYRLWSMPYRRSLALGMGGMIGSSTRPIELATVTYESGERPEWQMPEQLITIDPLPLPGKMRQFVLSQQAGMGMGRGGMGAGMGLSFTINGRTFDHARIDTRVRLGDVEDWDFVNTTMMDHPMHVHTNAFQIVQSDGCAAPGWKDTVLVKAGQTVRVRTRFEDFTGLSVYHCHILDHEDMGMMGTLQID